MLFVVRYIAAMRGSLFIRIVFFSCFTITTSDSFSQTGFVSNSPALAYWTVGKGELVVIVLHGGPAAAHNYLRPEWDKLSEVSTVIYYDQRGTGKSGKADCYTWQHHVQDLKNLVNTLAKGKKVVLAGSSWGTMLALLYAYTHPQDVKGIILSGTVNWLGKGEAPKQCTEYLPDLAYYTSSGIDTSLQYVSLKDRKVYKASDTTNTDIKERLKNDKYFQAPFTPRLATSLSLKEAPLLEELKKIKIPVLLFEGKGECVETKLIKDGAQQYANVLPAVELVAISDACHDPWFTHSKEFFKKCFEFIKKIN